MNKKFINLCVISTLALSSATIMSTPLAHAEELSKDVVKNLSFVDKGGEEISGTVSNESFAPGEFNLHVDLEFPDDAKPGDYIDIETSQKMEYAFTDKFFLENTDGVVIATVTKKNDKTLRITLDENARDMVNRSAELTLSTSGDPFKCTSEDLKENPLAVKVGNFDYPLSTKITIQPKACKVNTNPHPTGVIPIPQMRCNTYGGYLRFKDQYTYNGREHKNILLGFPPFTWEVQPGDITMFNTVTLQFDANSKKQDNPRSFMMNIDEFKKSIKEGKAFNVVQIPATYFEDEDPNDDDYHPKQDVLPTARLFPNKTLAAAFKKEVIDKYGEDVYHNTDNAFWNTNWSKKADIYNIAVKQYNKFIADNIELTSYKPDEGKFTAKIKNANQLSKMVNPENNSWTKLSSNNSTFKIELDISDSKDGNTLFAPYQGAGLYSGVKLSYAGDKGDQYNGNCVTGDDWFVGEINGAGRGEPLPPATFEVEKEAEQKEIKISDDNKYTANYKIKVSNTSKTTDSTTSAVIDDPNFPEGFNIDNFTSNDTTIKPDKDGKYKISDGVVLKAGESKTFNIKINGTVDNPSEEAITAAGKCELDGTGNKDLGLFNIVSMKEDTNKDNNDACITTYMTPPSDNPDTPDTPDTPDKPDTPDSTTPTTSEDKPDNKETPGKPSIKTVKLINNDDSNTKDTAVKLGAEDDTMKVSIQAQNTGETELKDVTIIDDTYVNDSIKDAKFTVLDSNNNITGRYQNGEIILKPGETAVKTVEVKSPDQGEHHVDTVTVTGTPTGDNVPKPGEPGSDSFPTKVTDDDPANAIRDKEDSKITSSQETTPKSTSSKETTSKNSTTRNTPVNTTTRENTPHSNPVGSVNNPQEYTPVQQGEQLENNTKVDTGGSITKSIATMIKQLFN